jgi:hypothetical protein
LHIWTSDTSPEALLRHHLSIDSHASNLLLLMSTSTYNTCRACSQPQGVGQLGYSFNWGDGYVTDSTIINPASYITDSRPFFTADTAATRGYR